MPCSPKKQGIKTDFKGSLCLVTISDYRAVKVSYSFNSMQSAISFTLLKSDNRYICNPHTATLHYLSYMR